MVLITTKQINSIMNKLYNQLLSHINENKTWSESEERSAWNNIERWRCSISSASPLINDAIDELKSDFALNNGLDPDALDDFDNSEIFFDLD